MLRSLINFQLLNSQTRRNVEKERIEAPEAKKEETELQKIDITVEVLNKDIKKQKENL